MSKKNRRTKRPLRKIVTGITIFLSIGTTNIYASPINVTPKISVTININEN